MKVLASINTEQLRRYPDPMGKEFRQAAAQVNSVEPEQIMCCNGGDDLLRIAISAICGKNRSLAYPVPTYSLYVVLAQIQGCQVVEAPFDGEFNLPSKLAATGAALTIVCNPNAPSGSFVRTEELASLASELKGVLLIDEAYVDFADQNCASLTNDFDNVIILRSMSKGYALAGLRFGYAIAAESLIDQLVKVKDSYNVDALAIAAATAAIKDRVYFEQNRAKVITERSRLSGELKKLGFVVLPSYANFVLAAIMDRKAAMIYDMLVKRNIYVRYFDTSGLSDKLRITVGTPEQNGTLLAALREILS
jgi:histidinol-phosphate aminotransferase